MEHFFVFKSQRHSEVKREETFWFCGKSEEEESTRHSQQLSPPEQTSDASLMHGRKKEDRMINKDGNRALNATKLRTSFLLIPLHSINNHYNHVKNECPMGNNLVSLRY